MRKALSRACTLYIWCKNPFRLRRRRTVHSIRIGVSPFARFANPPLPCRGCGDAVCRDVFRKRRFRNCEVVVDFNDKGFSKPRADRRHVAAVLAIVLSTAGGIGLMVLAAQGM